MAAPLLKSPPVPPTPPTLGAPPAPPVDESVVALGQLFTVLSQDPKQRGKILDIIQEAAPNLHIPEVAVARQADAKVESATKELREANAQLTDRLSRVEGDMQRTKWQEMNGVDDEEYSALANFAKERKIHDPDSALDYFRKVELGRPRGTGSTAQMTEESRKLLYKNPKQWAENEAYKILNESRRRRGA